MLDVLKLGLNSQKISRFYAFCPIKNPIDCFLHLEGMFHWETFPLPVVREGSEAKRGPMIGGVGERLIPPVLKTGIRESVSGVRISPPPRFTIEIWQHQKQTLAAAERCRVQSPPPRFNSYFLFVASSALAAFTQGPGQFLSLVSLMRSRRFRNLRNGIEN